MKFALPVAIAVAAFLCAAGPACADSIAWEGPVDNNYAGDISGQLGLEVTYLSATEEVCFHFTNAATISSEVREIYFRETLSTWLHFDPANDHPLGLDQSTTTDFELYDTSPPNPSGLAWNTWTVGEKKAVFGASADAKLGLDDDADWVEITFDMKSGGLTTFNGLMAYLNNENGEDGSAIAMHIGGLPGGESDVYYNGSTPMPEPGTLALLGLGLVCIALVRRRQ